MSLTHVVDPDVLYRKYFYVTSDSRTITDHMRYVAGLCKEQFDLSEGAFVVEMGSNTGEQLAEFRDLGMRTLGVDPARDLAALAAERGVETLPDFFSAAIARRIKKEYGTAQLLLGLARLCAYRRRGRCRRGRPGAAGPRRGIRRRSA